MTAWSRVRDAAEVCYVFLWAVSVQLASLARHRLAARRQRAKCPFCRHRRGDHHDIVGCQHLTPRYDDRGWLRQHDRCECRVLPRLAPSFAI